MTWMESASSKWLAGIASFVTVLIIVSVLISIFANDGTDLLPADTPEGTVQRYLQALTEDDLIAAYGYISEDVKVDCKLEYFIQTSKYQREQNFGAALTETNNIAGRSIVGVDIIEPGSGAPFGSGRYTFRTSFTLMQEDGEWLITEPPWPVSVCAPYQKLPMSPAIPPATPEAKTSATGLTVVAVPYVLPGEGGPPRWSS
jgi:hypothetical protein